MPPSRDALPWTAITLAGLVAAALLVVGVPLGSLLTLGLVLMCPLMMAGMHPGRRSDDHRHSGPSDP